MKGGRPLSIYPSEKDCILLLKDAGCNRRVIVHCCTVWTMAEAIAEKIPCDFDLVRAGALLHDIGRAENHSILHAVIGHSIIKNLGLPNNLAEIVRKHTGAGLDEYDIEEFNLPPGDYIPKTIEEKIVAHADNLVSDNKFVPHTHSVDKLKNKGASRGGERIEKLHKELSELYGEDLDNLVQRIGPYPTMKGACAEFTVPLSSRL